MPFDVYLGELWPFLHGCETVNVERLVAQAAARASLISDRVVRVIGVPVDGEGVVLREKN